MHIEYRRNYDKSYMVIKGDDTLDTYERGMLINGKFSSLLLADYQQTGTAGEYWYEISALEPMKNRLEYGRFAREDMILLLTHLLYAQSELQEYLLPPSHLLLEIETVFFDRKNKKILFAYYPADRLSYEEGIRVFFEEVLRGIGSGEGDFIADLYKAYDLLRMDNFSLEEILESIRKPENREERTVLPSLPAEPVINQTDEIDYSDVVTRQVHKEKEKRAGFWDSFKKEEAAGPRKTKKSKKEDDLIMVCEEPMATKTKETELLYAPEEKTRRLRYSGSRGLQDISLSAALHTVGSDKRGNSDPIDSATVSKFHARITCSEAGIFAEDMNSLNGTFVNNKPLNYQEKHRLFPGDRIRFADEEYVLE